MPAPVPIVIRYGQDPNLIGGLASAAGSAQYSQMRARQDYEDWLRRRAMDNELLTTVLNNRSRENVASMQLEQPSSRSMQDASGYARQLAQRTGSLTSSTGQAKSQVDLAIEEEKLKQLQAKNAPQTIDSGAELHPSMSMTTDTGDHYFTDSAGRILTNPGPDQVAEAPTKGVYTRPGQRQIPSAAAAQVAYLDRIKDTLDPAQASALYAAAKSGQLKMDQLIDDARLAVPKSPVDRVGNADALASAKDAREASLLKQIASLPPEQRVAVAKQHFNTPFADDSEVEQMLAGRLAIASQQSAQPRAVQNSGGRTPTGGNPIPVRSPDEARRLPSGTVILLPDGSLGRVP